MRKQEELFTKDTLGKEDLISLLGLDAAGQKELFYHSGNIKEAHVGKKVYFRGLIEFSNICSKNCFYCGIRKGNSHTKRYNLSDEEILAASRFAHQEKYASLVLQSGELASPVFTQRVTRLLQKIHQETNNELRVTLSLGEQSRETYREWFDAGAHRYLLRIETSDPEFYRKLHPSDDLHCFDKRLEALHNLRDTGYQTGTGVMIGLPFQTIEQLADDLLFMRDFGIDMVGMGPYIEHEETPLYEVRHHLWPIMDRFNMALKMIACLRMLMPKINIAAATALQAIDPMGREKALKIGANVIMPNITPGIYRDNYDLYNNKPCTDENSDDCTHCLKARVGMTGNEIGFGEWGDSSFFRERTRK
ncbi:MAG: [FeFe] hydrogenase H-cluster radical SAM maturase HydE [Bacteroidales bacterium]|nr:[FeFe] hydrogenase H-cluster radical SAM maturase HydE [Bacteroidales bacterium]